MLAQAYSALLQYLQVILIACAFVLLVAIALFLRRVPRLYRSLLAHNWPMTQGRVERGEVMAFAQQSVAQMGYSYSVGGAIYSGFFTQQFGDEQDAREYMDRVKVVVRYHPGKSALSAVRSADQNALSIPNRKSFLAQLAGNVLIEHFTHTDRDAEKSSHDWPTIRGRVESGKVTRERDEDHWYLLSFHTGEIGYSYSVDGNYYAGSNVLPRRFRAQVCRGTEGQRSKRSNGALQPKAALDFETAPRRSTWWVALLAK